MLVSPFRVFGYVAHRRGRYRRTMHSRNSLLVQSSEPGEVPALLVLRSHYAVGRFLGCVVFPRRAVLDTIQRPVHTLFEFRVPPELQPNVT